MAHVAKFSMPFKDEGWVHSASLGHERLMRWSRERPRIMWLITSLQLEPEKTRRMMGGSKGHMSVTYFKLLIL